MGGLSWTLEEVKGLPEASFVPLLRGGSSFFLGSYFGMVTFPLDTLSICYLKY